MSPEERRKLLERNTTATRPTVATQPRKTPTENFRELFASIPTRKTEVATPEPARPKFGGASLSMPKQTLPASSSFVEKSQTARLEGGARSRDWIRKNFAIGKFIFGRSEDEYTGTRLPENKDDQGIVGGLVESVRSRGILRFLQKNNMMGEAEKTQEYTGELMRQGNDRESAITKAREYYLGNESVLSEAEKNQLKTLDRTRAVFGFLELTDLFPGFRAAKMTLGASHIRSVVKSAAEAPTAVSAREILTKNIPQLKNKQELDAVVETIQTLNNPVKSEAFISDIMRGSLREQTDFGTPAQRSLYGQRANVAGGRGSSAEAIVSVRDEVTKILRGEGEVGRLSNADILRSEMKAGSIPFKQSVDEPIPVYVTQNVSRIRVGQRVSLNRAVADELAETAKDVKEMTAKIDDLVRLPDGTFVYAPKEQVGRGISPSIKSVIKSQREKVAKIEADRVKQSEALKKAESDAAAREQREAAAAARSSLLQKTASIEKAKKDIAELPKKTTEKVAEIKAQKIEAVEEVTSRVTKARANLRSAQTKVNTLLRKMDQAKTVQDKKNYQIKLDEARTALAKAKNEMPDRVAIEKEKAAIRKNYDDQIKSVKAEERATLRQAQETIGLKPAKKVSTEKTPTTDSVVVTVTKTLKIHSGSKGAIEPLKSNGSMTASEFASRIKQEGAEMLSRVGGDVNAIPEHHAIMSNEVQMKNAFNYVAENPEKAYLEFINADFKSDVPRAAVYNVLTKTDFLLNDPVKMENVVRTFFKEGTRLGQELQARKIVGQLDYGTIIGRLTTMTQDIATKRGISITKETEKLVQELGTKLDDIGGTTKATALKAVDEITCQ